VRFPKNIEVLISDTVGFIRDLPEELLDTFRSTLEELNDADLLLHLVDISSPGFKREIETVEKILSSLGLDKIPRKLVFNKIDMADPEVVANEARRYNVTAISALTGKGLSELAREAGEELTRIKAGRGALTAP
jgi:GTP-binding protein HflX